MVIGKKYVVDLLNLRISEKFRYVFSLYRNLMRKDFVSYWSINFFELNVMRLKRIFDSFKFFF